MFKILCCAVSAAKLHGRLVMRVTKEEACTSILTVNQVFTRLVFTIHAASGNLKAIIPIEKNRQGVYDF